MMQMLGHDGPPTNYWRENLITGAKLLRCPMRDLLEAPDEVGPELEEMRTVDFVMFQRGHLKLAGGIAQQPARWLAYMTEMERVARVVDTLGDGEDGE